MTHRSSPVTEPTEADLMACMRDCWGLITDGMAKDDFFAASAVAIQDLYRRHAQQPASPVTDDMVERAWAAIVGSDVAPTCFEASIIRADIRDALEAVIHAQQTISPEYAAELGRQVDELEAENAALRHDLERHMKIAADLLNPRATAQRPLPQTLTGEIACILEDCDPPEFQSPEALAELIRHYQPTWSRIVSALTSTDHSPPVFKATQKFAESGPAVTLDCAGGETVTRPDGGGTDANS